MFGGMTTARRAPRRGTVATKPKDEDERSASADSVPSAPTQPAPSAGKQVDKKASSEPSAATANTVFQTGGTSVFLSGGPMNASDFEEDPDLARLRKRLERFYSHYNPAKLSNVDNTMTQYRGKEAELFDALIKKYGPEPSSMANPASGDAAHDPKSAFGFGDNAAASFTIGATTQGFVASDGGGGFAPDSGGFGTAEFGAAPTGGFGAANAGGFGFAPTAFPPVPFSDVTGAAPGFATGDAPSGFGFASDAAAGGFGFAAEAAAPPTAGFGFGTPAAEPAIGNGAIPPTEKAAAASQPSDEDSDGEYSRLEKQDALIQKASAAVDDSRAELAKSVTQAADLITQRRSLITRHKQLECQVEALIAGEEYAAAEAADAELHSVCSQLVACDDKFSLICSSFRHLVARVKATLEQTAAVYQRERSALIEIKEDQERKTSKYFSETQLRLDQQGDRVRAALEKASRQMTNFADEVDRVKLRLKTIDDKINEQTREVRSQRDEVATQAEALDKQIKEIEAQLATKRRQLAERKATLGELNGKLQSIQDDHKESRASVELQMSDESSRLTEATARVAELSSQQRKLHDDEATLNAEREDVKKELADHQSKIANFEKFAFTIAKQLVQSLEEFSRDAIGSALETRKAALTSDGDSVLPRPHRGESDPMAVKISTIELQLQDNAKNLASLAARLSDIAALVPVVEAAKKAAAAAKQFKDAQTKTDELKKLNEERESLSKKSSDLTSCETQLRGELQHLRSAQRQHQLEGEKQRGQIIDNYAMKIRACWVAAQAATPLSSANIAYLPQMVSDEHHLSTDDADDVVSVARKLTDTLLGELSSCTGIAIGQLLNEPQDETPLPKAPVAAAPVATSPAEAMPAPQKADVEARLVALQQQLDEATEAEAYDRCEEINEQIESLNAVLSKM